MNSISSILDKSLLQRLITGLLYGLVIIYCTTPFLEHLFFDTPIISGAKKYSILLLALAFISVFECATVMRMNKKRWEYFALFPISILILYRFYRMYSMHQLALSFKLSEIMGLALIGVAVYTLFRYSNELMEEGGKLIFSVIYACMPYAFALGLPMYEDHSGGVISLEPFLLFVLIWSSDTFAYFVGRFFGKNKMAPKISPKKTWEGFAGGFILTLILGYFIETQIPNIRGNWVVVGGLVAIFAPLGDLVESQLKRMFGVKDSGKILPGHGGILDRLDSFILCAPVIFLYFQLMRYL